MGFPSGLFGGGGLGGGQIILGAHTAGLVNGVRGAVRQIDQSLSSLATVAQVQGTRTAQGINKVGTAAERNAVQVRTANATAGRAMAAGAKEAEAAGTRWTKVFALIGTAAKVTFIGIVGAVLLGTKEAADFEKQWAAVNKTVGGSHAQMEQLRSDIRGIARDTPIGLGDLAKIAETAGALGVPTKNIKEFTRVVAMIGSTTNVSTEQAASSLGVMGNIVNLTNDDYKRFASTLVDLGNKGASTEKQILDITTRSAAAGKLMGLQTQDILAIASTTASMGVNPEAGGTGLATIYGQIIKITAGEQKHAKGTKDLTKDRERLAVAEQKLAETRANGHAKTSQIMTAENRVADAQRKLNADSAANAKAGAGGVESMAKTAGVTVKQWKELLKDHPEEAFLKLVTGLGKLTAPQQLKLLSEWGMGGLRVRNIMLLLAKNPGELARQLGIADVAWAKGTAAQEAYAKKTANLIDRLKVFFNIIKDELISLGDLALPVLTKIVDFLIKNLPGALNFLGGIWKAFWKVAGPPIAEVGKSLGRLLAAFAGPDAGKGVDWAGAIRTAFGGLANVVATVATMLARIIDIGAEFVKSPIGQFAVKAIVPFLALMAVLSGIMALAKRLTGATVGIAKNIFGFLPGLPGFLKGKADGTSPESQALVGAGAKLTGSAAALQRAAAALEASSMTPGQKKALANAIGGLPGGGTISGIAPSAGRTRPMTVAEQMAYAGTANLNDLEGANFRYPRVPIGTGAPQYGFDPRGRLTSVPIERKADYLANQKAFDTAGRSIVERGQMALASGVQSAAGGIGRLKSFAGGAFGAIKGVGSLIGKAFWPLFLADMATEFLKQPISEFVANNTPYKNAAKEMATDFWGGAADLLISALNGTDAWVGHADITTIGKARISTLTIAKLGFTSAEIGNIQAPTLANGGFTLQQTATDALREKYKTMSPAEIIAAAKTAGIDVSAYNPTSAKGRLGNGVLEDITSQFGSALGIDTAVQNMAFSQKDVQPLIDKLVAGEVDGVTTGIHDAVDAALVKMGYSHAQIDTLPDSTIVTLGHIIGANADGKINALVAWAVRNALTPAGNVSGIVTSSQFLPKSVPHISTARYSDTGPLARANRGADRDYGSNTVVYDRNGRAITLAGDSRRNSRAGFDFPYSSLTSGPPTKLALANQGGVVDYGQPLMGVDRNGNARRIPGDRSRNSRVGFDYGTTVGNEAQTQAANQAFNQNLAKVLQPTRDTYRRWLKNVANDPTGNRQAAAESGQQFVDQFGAQIVAAGKKSPHNTRAIVEMAKSILGPEAVTKNAKGVEVLATGAWTAILSIYNEAANASGADQRAKIAKTIRDIIVAGAKDGSSEAAKQMTPLFFSENQKAIAKAMQDPTGKQMTSLLASYNKANPTAQFGNVAGFKAAYAAWKKTGMLDPTQAGEASMKLSDVHSVMEDVAAGATALASAMTNLMGVIQAFLDRVAPRTGGGGGGGNAGSRPQALGAVFDTRGRMEMTVGEAGGEHVAVLRNFRRISLPDMRAAATFTPRITGGERSGPSRTQQIFADKIQVLGPADERSLLERFAFLGNN